MVSFGSRSGSFSSDGGFLGGFQSFDNPLRPRSSSENAIDSKASSSSNASELHPSDKADIVNQEKSNKARSTSIKRVRTGVHIVAHMTSSHYAVAVGIGAGFKSHFVNNGILAGLLFPSLVHTTMSDIREVKAHKLTASTYQQMGGQITEIAKLLQKEPLSLDDKLGIETALNGLKTSKRLELSPAILSDFTILQTKWDSFKKGATTQTDVQGSVGTLSNRLDEQVTASQQKMTMCRRKSIAHGISAFLVGVITALQLTNVVLSEGFKHTASALLTTVTVIGDVAGIIAIAKGVLNLVSYGREALKFKADLNKAKSALAEAKAELGKMGQVGNLNKVGELKNTVAALEKEVKDTYKKYRTSTNNAVKGALCGVVGSITLAAHIIFPGAGMAVTLAAVGVSLAIAGGIFLIQKRSETSDTKHFDLTAGKKEEAAEPSKGLLSRFGSKKEKSGKVDSAAPEAIRTAKVNALFYKGSAVEKGGKKGDEGSRVTTNPLRAFSRMSTANPIEATHTPAVNSTLAPDDPRVTINPLTALNPRPAVNAAAIDSSPEVANLFAADNPYVTINPFAAVNQAQTDLAAAKPAATDNLAATPMPESTTPPDRGDSAALIKDRGDKPNVDSSCTVTDLLSAMCLAKGLQMP